MKKLIATLCALLLICFAVAVSAEAPVSNLYKPNTSETLKALIGGKTYEAGITGWESVGEDEDAKFTLTITVSERDRFDPAVIENLKEHDILRFGNGTAIMVMEVIRDEFGVTVKDGFDNSYCFFKAEDGNAYIATTDTENPFYTEVFTVKVLLEKDINFLDWSDPENLEGPVKLGFDELISLIQEGKDFSPYNTKVTFDENGKLVKFLYSYSPWN